MVGLLCLQPAKHGGRSSLVSSVAIYNALRAENPELALALFDPIETDRRGEVADGERPYFTIPVFNWFDGHFAGIFQRQYIDSARRFDGVALDQCNAQPRHTRAGQRPCSIESTSSRATSSWSTTTSSSTTAPPSDGPTPPAAATSCACSSRPAERNPLPPIFAERFGTVVPGERGGVSVPRALWKVPLDAE